jgi:hypothetical protein
MAISARAQHVASIDLSRLSAPTKSAGELPLPKGCEKLLPGPLGDGAVIPPKNESREIVVELINQSHDLVIGNVAQAEAQLRNTGKYPIWIPWSTDKTIVMSGQNPTQISWEEGNFNFVLQSHDKLKRVTQSLYGSKVVAGSEIMIRPGEWVTAKVPFELTLEYPLPGQLIKRGEGRLHVEWEQNSYTRSIKDCKLQTGFFEYGRLFYHEQNPQVMIRLK